jgi:hypothetical protein
MGQTPPANGARDEQSDAEDRGVRPTEPTLELPSLPLPRLARRRHTTGPIGPSAGSEVTEPTPGAETTEQTQGPERPVIEDPAPADVPAGEPTPCEPTPSPPEPRLTLSALPGPVAAALTGLAVGATGSFVTYGAMAGCEVVRGVSSCGGAAGLFVLVAILGLMVVLGAALLSTLGVSDGTSTSMLAVGLVAVVTMLVLVDVVSSPWMFLVVPALGVAAYLAARWVTTRYDDEPRRPDWS